MKENNSIIVTGGINARRHVRSALTIRHTLNLMLFHCFDYGKVFSHISHIPNKKIYSVNPSVYKDLKLTNSEKNDIKVLKSTEYNTRIRKWNEMRSAQNSGLSNIIPPLI